MEKFPYCRNRHSWKKCQASGHETSDPYYLHDKTFTDLKKSQMLLVEATWLYYKSLFGGIIPCASCPVSDLHVVFEFSSFQISLLNFEPFSMYFFFLSQLLIRFPGLLLPKHSASIVSMISSDLLLCSAMARVCWNISPRLRLLFYLAYWLNEVSDLAEKLKHTYDT